MASAIRPIGWLAAILRLAIAALVVVGIVSILLAAVEPKLFNFFGYFTVQANLILAAVYVVSAVLILRGRQESILFTAIRACATTYIMVVGIVYVTLLAPLGADVGMRYAWVNVVLHYLTPVYALVDWIVCPKPHRLPFRRLWLVVIYPAVWLAVVLIRGATDGWVPYPFLDPRQGYVAVAGYALAILVVMLAFGALVFGLSRVNLRRSGAPSAR